jgi:hypothetical protein
MYNYTQLGLPNNPSSPGTSHYVFHPSHPSLRTNEPLFLGVNKVPIPS